MLFIVLDFKDTHGRKGSKMCTSTLLSFLTLFSASCSWQQNSCELALQGVFLFIRLCGVLTSLANPVLLSCAGSSAMLGAVLGVCRSCLSTDPALQAVRDCKGCPVRQGHFIPLRSECLTGSCAGYDLLELKSTQEKVIKCVRFNFIASLMLETSDFENYQWIGNCRGKNLV